MCRMGFEWEVDHQQLEARCLVCEVMARFWVQMTMAMCGSVEDYPTKRDYPEMPNSTNSTPNPSSYRNDVVALSIQLSAASILLSTAKEIRLS